MRGGILLRWSRKRTVGSEVEDVMWEMECRKDFGAIWRKLCVCEMKW